MLVLLARGGKRRKGGGSTKVGGGLTGKGRVKGEVDEEEEGEEEKGDGEMDCDGGSYHADVLSWFFVNVVAGFAFSSSFFSSCSFSPPFTATIAIVIIRNYNGSVGSNNSSLIFVT